MNRVFYCDRCRVWTGDAAKSPRDAAAAEESDLQSIGGRIAIEWSPSRRGVRLSRTLHGAGSANAPTKRSVFVNEDSTRSIGVYCPSPFSMAVVVQVDVSDTRQQCLVLSRVSTEHAQDETAFQLLRMADRTQMLEFLSALHGHLKEVPLTTEARELLATKRTRDVTASLHGKQTTLKRRRSISPADFYGRSANVSSPLTATAVKNASGEDMWKSFYERLQFNVSHSLMCQLEGMAPLSASFPRQQEAFEFVDQVVAFRERLAQQARTPPVVLVGDGSDEPRMFCFEGANEGKRRFWVTTLSAFWKEYTAIPEGSRHVCEIIREGVPCRLYFDLEFNKPLNPQLDGDQLVTRLISLLQIQLYRQYYLVIDPAKHVIQLESSTPDKFSRHLTVHLPNGELFVDNIHVGAFVRQLIHELVESEEATRSQFLVRDSASDDAQRQLFIDVGVYTRNRMFRVLGSSKFRKTAVLRPLGNANTNGSLDHELFLRSLVCPRSGLTRRLGIRLLRCEDTVSLKRYGAANGARAPGFSLQPMRSVESKSSIYPALDAFIRSISTAGGVQGEIRAVHLLYPTAPELESNDMSSRDHHPESALSEPAKIVYHMMKNRWCENVSRPHKSNNVMFVVDLPMRTYLQRCHDPQCQAMDYRSPARPLPRDLDLVLEARAEAAPP